MKIEVDKAMLRMAYNIIDAHVCYDFTTFLVDEIKINMEKVDMVEF